MNSNNTINFMLIACIIISSFIIFSNVIKKILKFIFNGLIGVVTIYLLNEFFVLIGISINVGINIFTLAISALLGLPGVLLTFAIQTVL